MDKLWPLSARSDANSELWLGGCAASALAAEFGTPLYVFDEETLRTQVRAYREALASHYPGTAQAAYASKAYLCTAIAQLFAEEGLDLDVVSGGELYVALQAGFPPSASTSTATTSRAGNSPKPWSPASAVSSSTTSTSSRCYQNWPAADSQLQGAQLPASSFKVPVPIWLRLSPGVAAHTHAHIQTGRLDTSSASPSSRVTPSER